MFPKVNFSLWGSTIFFIWRVTDWYLLVLYSRAGKDNTFPSKESFFSLLKVVINLWKELSLMMIRCPTTASRVFVGYLLEGYHKYSRKSRTWNGINSRRQFQSKQTFNEWWAHFQAQILIFKKLSFIEQTVVPCLPSPSEEMDLQGTQIPDGIEVPTFVGSRKLSCSLCYLSLRTDDYSRTSQNVSIKVNLGQFSFWRFMSKQFGDCETIE